jgi:hypothetical protein
MPDFVDIFFLRADFFKYVTVHSVTMDSIWNTNHRK